MNTKQLIAGLLVLAAAGSAFAVTPYPDDHPVSTKSRAEVQAELAEAVAQGLMNQSHADYPVLASQKSNPTRAQAEQQASNKLDNTLYQGA